MSPESVFDLLDQSAIENYLRVCSDNSDGENLDKAMTIESIIRRYGTTLAIIEQYLNAASNHPVIGISPASINLRSLNGQLLEVINGLGLGLKINQPYCFPLKTIYSTLEGANIEILLAIRRRLYIALSSFQMILDHLVQGTGLDFSDDLCVGVIQKIDVLLQDMGKSQADVRIYLDGSEKEH